MARVRTQVRPAARVLLVGPCSLAGARLEPLAAAICSFALAAVVVAELATPDVVVGVTAPVPLIAAMWALSARYAAAVGVLAAACFVLMLIAEVGNRPTVFCVGVVGLVLALPVRFYATGLAAMDTGMHASITAWPGSGLDAQEKVDSLTPRELEVAHLAASGYSALEIAAQLHISERTVESHLANVFAKLGIHSRSALRRIGATLPDR